MYGPRCAKTNCPYQHPGPEETAMATDQPIPDASMADSTIVPAAVQPQPIDTAVPQQL
jgi:hypothetical protein